MHTHPICPTAVHEYQTTQQCEPSRLGQHLHYVVSGTPIENNCTLRAELDQNSVVVRAHQHIVAINH